MADFILVRKSRNFFGNMLHAVLNISLGIISIAATVMSGSWLIGVLLVFLSKWRVFAVRPHFWWINIKANLVDYLVGVSVVLTAYFAGTTWLPIHYILMIFYVIWLTIIKPLSSERGTILQALLAIFLGSNVAVIAGSTINSVFTVAVTFIAGYAACRHVLIQDSNSADNFSLISLACGLLAAEFAWVLHHWNIVYTFGNSGIIISQLSVILSIITFIFYYIRASLARYDGHFRSSALALPVFFCVLCILILIIGFSEPFFNI